MYLNPCFTVGLQPSNDLWVAIRQPYAETTAATEHIQ